MKIAFFILVICVFFLSSLIYRRWYARRFFKHWKPFYSGKSEFETIDGVKLHYIKEGKGPDILLLHGIAASIFCWRFLIPLLSPRLRVWAIDLKGFGQSDAPKNSKYDLQTQSALIVAFIKKKQMQKVTLVGNSMGAAIAAQVALLEPNIIQKLILINSAHDPKVVGVDLRPARRLVALAAPFVNRFAVKHYMRKIYGVPFNIPPDVVNAYMAPYLKDLRYHHSLLESFDLLTDPNLSNRLSEITVPTLIIWGTNDRVVPLKYGETLHQALKSSQFSVHPWAGHHLQEEDPQWLADRIIEFVV